MDKHAQDMYEAMLEEKKPEAFLLENVKRLTTHDGGQIFHVILDENASSFK